ncbi:MAG: MFS transporter [Gammaproteobacteria bacterium]
MTKYKTRSIFYGWWNVLCAFIGLALSHATIAIFSFGTFVKPLQAEFGWQRGEIAFALTVNNLTVLIVSPLLGILIDKIGVRKVLMPSLMLLAVIVATMTLLSGNIWHFYILYFLIPLFGAATLPHSYSRIIIAWFYRLRGMALGISLAGIGAGAAVIPVLMQSVINSHGWRTAYMVYALLVLLISLPLSYYLVRETPKEMGLKADGDHESTDRDKGQMASGAIKSIGLTLKQSIKTSTFWLMLGSFLLAGMVMSSMFVHLIPMLIDRGLDPSVAAYGAMALGVSLIVGRIASGFLMDHFFAPYIAAIFLSGMVVGMVIFATGTSGPMVFVAAALVGLASGSEMSEASYLISRYFGYLAFGRIYGVIFSAFQLGGAIGAPVLGIYQDKAGDYIGALWVLVAVGLVSTILIALLREYPQLEFNMEANDDT